MPQITRASLPLALLLSIFVLMLSGCGSSSSQSNFDSDTGHPAGWLLAGHKTEASAHMETCAECHGSDYQGGIAKISCTACHIGSRDSYHPTQWGTYAYALHGGYAKANGTAGCATASCHGANLGGVFQSGPSCTACHIGGPTSKHPIEWSADLRLHEGYVTANGISSCSTSACHGSQIIAGSSGCSACH